MTSNALENATGADLTKDALRVIASAEGAERDVLVDDFLRDHDGLCRAIAARLCRQFRADQTTWMDDFVSLTRIAAFNIIVEIIDRPPFLDEIRKFDLILGFRAKSAVTKFVESSAGFSYATGMTTARRRRDELERTREQLTIMMGAEPTDTQIVEATNERMLATRKNAKHEQMLATTDDLHLDTTTVDIDEVREDLSGAAQAEGVLHATERREVARLTIEECRMRGEELGAVAEMFMAPFLGAGTAEQPTASEISRRLGRSHTQVRKSLTTVREVASVILATKYDVTSVDG